MIALVWTLVGPPLAVGIIFSIAAGLLRRRFGPLALVALTVLLMASAAGTVRFVPFPAGALALPAMPALIVAALVQEWQVQRKSSPLIQALWTTAAFTVIGTAVLVDLAPKLMIVA